jgi:uncharacterized protein YggU (UPF0235/DUF167 family)
VNITVHIKPGSSKGPLVEALPIEDGAQRTFTVYVQQRAVDGQANTALIALIAKHLGVAKSSVGIVRGHTSRIKTLSVDGLE